jgi:hypothetical protein
MQIERFMDSIALPRLNAILKSYLFYLQRCKPKPRRGAIYVARDKRVFERSPGLTVNDICR